MQNPNLGQGPGQQPYYGPDQKYVDQDVSPGKSKGLKPYQKRQILFGAIGVIVVIGIVASFFIFGDDDTGERVEIEFWGVDSEDYYARAISYFRESNPGTVINYVEKDAETYRRDLTNALAEGEGPDLYMINNNWLPREEGRLEPLNSFLGVEEGPADVLQEYPNVVRHDFARESEDGEILIYALPLYVDTLALYYNEDYFNSAGLARPPETWEEFIEYSAELRDLEGNRVDVAGVAMGSGRNVEHSADILSMLMLQSGAHMNNIRGDRATFNSTIREAGERFNPSEEAARFYTSFARTESGNYTWNLDQENSITAFAQGDAAMVFGYSDLARYLIEEEYDINFGIAKVPQPEGRRDSIAYADYWGVAVSRASQNKQRAWNFARSISGDPSTSALYLDFSNRPPSLRGSIDFYEDDEYRSVFAQQMLAARSWIQPIPEEVDSVFVNLLDEVVRQEKDEVDAVDDAARLVNDMFDQIYPDN